MAEKFDSKRLLLLGERLAQLGTDPCAFLDGALRAEMWFDWRQPLGDLLKTSDPARTSDVVAAPTFQHRLREARTTLRTIGAGPDLYVVPRDVAGAVGPAHVPSSISAVIAALGEMKAVGAALCIVGPEAPKKTKPRFEEQFIEQTLDGVTLVDDAGLPRFVASGDEMRPRHSYRPVERVEKNRVVLEEALAEARKASRGSTRRDEILRALDRRGRTPPYLRPQLADALASCPRGLSMEQLAYCLAYGIKPDRAVAETLKKRALERRKKRISRVHAGDIRSRRMSPR